MGMDKYLIDVNGQTQYHYLYNMLTDAGLDVCVSCNLEQYRDLPESHYKLVDQYDGIGPIGGIVAAINHNPAEAWLVVACDLVNVKPETITKLIDSVDDQHDIITYEASDGKNLETTITIYQPSSFRSVLDAIDTGLYSLQRVLKDCKVKRIAPGDDAELKNVNSPEDLA